VTDYLSRKFNPSITDLKKIKMKTYGILSVHLCDMVKSVQLIETIYKMVNINVHK
jgi:hypothetical protein